MLISFNIKVTAKVESVDHKLFVFFRFITAENYLFEYYLKDKEWAKIKIGNRSLVFDTDNTNSVTDNVFSNYIFTYEKGDSILVDQGTCSQENILLVLNNEKKVIQVTKGFIIAENPESIDLRGFDKHPIRKLKFDHKELNRHWNNDELYFVELQNFELKIVQLNKDRFIAQVNETFLKQYFEIEFVDNQVKYFRELAFHYDSIKTPDYIKTYHFSDNFKMKKISLIDKDSILDFSITIDTNSNMVKYYELDQALGRDTTFTHALPR